MTTEPLRTEPLRLQPQLEFLDRVFTLATAFDIEPILESLGWPIQMGEAKARIGP